MYNKNYIFENLKIYPITLKSLENWQNEGHKIGIYGAGKFGKQWYEILYHFHFNVYCFIDNNPELWNAEIIDKIKCYNPIDFSDSDDIIFFACVNCELLLSLICRAKAQNIQIAAMNDLVDDLITFHPDKYFELLKIHADQEYTELFYVHDLARTEYAEATVKGATEKIAVYTGIFGNYDTYKIPQVFPDNIDYYLISDNKPDLPAPIHWLDAKGVIPNDISSPIIKNRYVKMHGYEIFKDYRYSVYLDGCVRVERDLSDYLPEGNLGISVFRHPLHDSVYYEALNQTNNNRVDTMNTIKQMERYINEGLPVHTGMAEMGVIGRDHRNMAGNDLMCQWWAEFCHGAMRDQFSFAYVLWKNSYSFADLSMIGLNRYKAIEIKTLLHPENSRCV